MITSSLQARTWCSIVEVDVQVSSWSSTHTWTWTNGILDQGWTSPLVLHKTIEVVDWLFKCSKSHNLFLIVFILLLSLCWKIKSATELQPIRVFITSIIFQTRRLLLWVFCGFFGSRVAFLCPVIQWEWFFKSTNQPNILLAPLVHLFATFRRSTPEAITHCFTVMRLSHAFPFLSSFAPCWITWSEITIIQTTEWFRKFRFISYPKAFCIWGSCPGSLDLLCPPSFWWWKGGHLSCQSQTVEHQDLFGITTETNDASFLSATHILEEEEEEEEEECTKWLE